MATQPTVVPLEASPGVSRYATLAAALRARVVSGEWPPGSALPAENLLANEHKVALGTMRRALELLVAEGEDMLKAHRREVNVAFLDLRGFTAFTERAAPEEVMGLLREYHGALGRLVMRHGGTLERFAGDSVMVFFNDPVPMERPAEQAVQGDGGAVEQLVDGTVADRGEQRREVMRWIGRQLVAVQGTVRVLHQHVGEGAADVDADQPRGAHAGTRALRCVHASGGQRCAHGRAASSCAAMRKSVASSA